MMMVNRTLTPRMLVAVLGLLTAMIPAHPARAEPGRPNVILIVCDDLGYADVVAYGQKKIKTPNIDRLAAEGMRFTQHYSGSPVCAPSRSCLLTGQHTGHTPVRANPRHARNWDRDKGDVPLPADTRTFPELFKDAGYATAVIGKWGLGRPGTSGDPKNQGFDHFFGYADHTHAHDYYPKYLWRNEQRVDLSDKQYSHDLLTEEALQFVRQQKNKPFLLYLAYTIPHTRLQVPSIEPYANESWPEPAKKLAAMITRMDGDVGRVMALLKEMKIDEKTLVVFTSDNGAFRIPQVPLELFNSNGPLRGYKRDVYEGGIRVPLIARWPGKVAAGAASDLVCANWDFLPTFAELLQSKPWEGTDGVSIAPTLLGRAAEQKPREFLYWEFNELGGQQAVRMGDWKGVRLRLADNPDAPLKLFNLKQDPGESNDVATDHPDVVKRIRHVMEEAYVPTDRYPRWTAERQGGKAGADEAE